MTVVSAQGRDYSAYQKPIKPSDLAGLSFAYCRVSDWSAGMGTDSEFTTDWAAMRAAGLHRGAYWYLLPSVNPVEQAAYFVTRVVEAGLLPGDMLVCDSEELAPNADAVTHAFCTTAASFASLAVGGPHCPMIVYANHNVGQHLVSCTGWPLWFAWPNTTAPPASLILPWKKWTFWQWGTVNGVDADAFNGTAADLDAWIASYQPHPRPPAPKPAPAAPEEDMVIIDVDRASVPAGKPWPGIFLLHGPQALWHIPDPGVLAVYRKLGLPEMTLTYPEYVLLGGK